MDNEYFPCNLLYQSCHPAHDLGDERVGSVTLGTAGWEKSMETLIVTNMAALSRCGYLGEAGLEKFRQHVLYCRAYCRLIGKRRAAEYSENADHNAGNCAW